MTPVPPPSTPCVRVRLDYVNSDDSLASSRFFLSYAGAAPSAATLDTLASDVSAAWGTHIAPNVGSVWTLAGVDIVDITTESGAFGTWGGSIAGGAGGTQLPSQVAVNVEFNLQVRYRGGKPRIFFPAPETSDQQDSANWSNTFVTGMGSAVTAFFAEIEALSLGSIGALAHVDISYYQGFKNVTNSSGRTRAVPQYRDTALVRGISGYAVKKLMSSQKRRRASTTL
jgi:hypothetical protein